MADEQPRGCGGLQFPQLFAAIAGQHMHAQGSGQIRANELAAGVVAMRPQDGKRVVVFGAHQRVDVMGRRQQRLFGLPLWFFVRDTHDSLH
ncbi:hypothetical protein D3C78_1576010 [compost metagenome]